MDDLEGYRWFVCAKGLFDKTVCMLVWCFQVCVAAIHGVPTMISMLCFC